MNVDLSSKQDKLKTHQYTLNAANKDSLRAKFLNIRQKLHQKNVHANLLIKLFLIIK